MNSTETKPKHDCAKSKCLTNPKGRPEACDYFEGHAFDFDLREFCVDCGLHRALHAPRK